MDRYITGFVGALEEAEKLLRSNEKYESADLIAAFMTDKIIINGRSAKSIATENASATPFYMPPPTNESHGV